jgi:hypothetical protein
MQEFKYTQRQDFQ